MCRARRFVCLSGAFSWRRQAHDMPLFREAVRRAAVAVPESAQIKIAMGYSLIAEQNFAEIEVARSLVDRLTERKKKQRLTIDDPTADGLRTCRDGRSAAVESDSAGLVARQAAAAGHVSGCAGDRPASGFRADAARRLALAALVELKDAVRMVRDVTGPNRNQVRARAAPSDVDGRRPRRRSTKSSNGCDAPADLATSDERG